MVCGAAAQRKHSSQFSTTCVIFSFFEQMDGFRRDDADVQNNTACSAVESNLYFLLYFSAKINIFITVAMPPLD